MYRTYIPFMVSYHFRRANTYRMHLSHLAIYINTTDILPVHYSLKLIPQSRQNPPPLLNRLSNKSQPNIISPPNSLLVT